MGEFIANSSQSSILAFFITNLDPRPLVQCSSALSVSFRRIKIWSPVRYRTSRKSLFNASYVDPDPQFWLAGSGSSLEYGSGSRRAKMTHKSEEN
jgi:hypothetical protein